MCLKNFEVFSFFSILKIPNISHHSILKTTYRKGDLHLLSFDKIDNSKLNIINTPQYCIEFQGNLHKKLEYLKLYKAVDFNKHYRDYFGFSMITERLYFNELAISKINEILKNFSIIVKDII